MKKNRLYSLLALLLFAGCIKLWAIEVTAGGLSGAVTDKSISRLEVSGEIDARDIKFIADELSALKSLDLSAVSIVAYSGDDAMFAGQKSFVAGEMPAYSFMGKKYETVVLPSAIKYIGTGAFAGCEELTSITIPASLDSIGDYAFNSCSAVTVVTLPQSMKKIGTGAFSRCTGLKSADLSALSATCTLGADMFSNCTALEKVTIGNAQSEIPAGMFACCNSLTGVEFDDASAIKSIGEEAFLSTALDSFDFPAFTDLKVIGRWAFAGVNLKEVVLPDNVESVGEGAFFYNESLENITLNENIIDIKDFMLAGCSELTGNVKVSYGAKSIGRYAFSDSKMTSVYMGSLDYIGDRAFENNTSLLSMSVEAKEAPALGEDVFSGIDQPNVKLNVVAESVASYKAAEQWKEFNIVGDLSTLEKVVNSCGIKAYFTGMTLNVEASENLESVHVYEPGGVLLASRRPTAMNTSIDMSQMQGDIYIVTVRTVTGHAGTAKLLRQ